MKRAGAYSSSCLQVILVYLYPFHCNSLFCRQKLQKSLRTLILWLKVINDDTIKKHAIGACYGKQHVCVYLQLFSQ